MYILLIPFKLICTSRDRYVLGSNTHLGLQVSVRIWKRHGILCFKQFLITVATFSSSKSSFHFCSTMNKRISSTCWLNDAKSFLNMWTFSSILCSFRLELSEEFPPQSFMDWTPLSRFSKCFPVTSSWFK